MDIVRAATQKDRPAIVGILEATTEFAPIDVKVATELMDCYLNDGAQSGYDVYVFDYWGTVGGYTCFGPTPLTEGTWDLYWIAVGNESRRRGIGRQLLTFTEGRVRENHGRMLLIETSSTGPYEAARSLYEKSGYRLAATVSDFYLPGDDKLIYQKYV